MTTNTSGVQNPREIEGASIATASAITDSSSNMTRYLLLLKIRKGRLTLYTQAVVGWMKIHMRL